MFSKKSRYKDLGDIVTSDAGGRSLESKRIRLLPEAKGTFLHTIGEVDRLDHLAYKYYKQSRKWWRICDANPEFLSPHALLGEEPIVTTCFPVTFNGSAAQPPWWELLETLSKQPGVGNVSIEEHSYLVNETVEHNGRQVVVNTEKFKRAVIITYNRLNITVPELKNFIAAKGFKVDKPENAGRIGKKIVIPPERG